MESIKVMLVDDEQLALIQLRKMLQEMTGFEIVGAYLDPVEAIEMASVLRPDVVFLDIHLPEIFGLRAAEMLNDTCPDVEIVFITAYDEHAVEAFTLNALDYVLKPLQRSRLAITVERLKISIESKRKDRKTSDPVRIHCLQTLQIEFPGQQPETMKWRTSKAQELFTFMFHHRGQLVRKSELFELLWSDFDVPKAMTHLYTTIYQVRQDLKRIGVNIVIRSLSIKDGYVLDAAGICIDTVEWERELRRLSPVSDTNVAEHQRVMDMYRGDYLQDAGYLWSENERQRLRTLWLQHVQLLGDYYVRQGRMTEALAVYHRMQIQCPYYEESYFCLMKLYDELEDRVAVEEQYKRLTLVLSEALDTVPSPKTEVWYAKWKGLRPQLESGT
ncbi:response regulator [Paenibacillus thalictri]|uniref:Response regulator n=1 Tax=Paenibacillus thalictri TaxID=2527873 RepID=A0A4Q9DN17_9BACL|nr:response regulator [Paenibacillus thalictri]TBL77285.1 response regulator [Paenibacillus thalictri]